MTAERRRDPPPPWRHHPLLQAGRRLERWVRDNLRAPMRRGYAATKHESQDKSLFAPGAMLLIPGELQRHDFAVLMQLKEKLNLRLVFLFYDLLGVLPPNDARLHDRSASDLPSSDFILREADLVLSISEYSAKMLRAHAASRGVATPPLKTIHLGHLIRAAPCGAAAIEGIAAGGFVLSVGDIVPRKNHALLVTVWRVLLRRGRSGVKPLVIAGRVGADGADLAREVTADPVLAKSIKILSNVDDDLLGWLYANCLFTVFPSRCEGYGLPVCESLAAGKVCIASSLTAIPEASQGLAIHLDPDDVEGWTLSVDRLMTDAEERRRQQARIAGFRAVTWVDTADEVRNACGVASRCALASDA